MKKTTKITTIILIFFFIIVTVIVARTMIGNHFKKKFSKRPPPSLIVSKVTESEFYDTIESFGTAIAKKTQTLLYVKAAQMHLKDIQTLIIVLMTIGIKIYFKKN